MRNSACLIFVIVSLLALTACKDDPSSASMESVAKQSSTTATKLHTPTSPMPEAFYHASAAELKSNFINPPEAVNPWVYWYWVNDHISKQGIERDLAAMQKAGIGTALIGIIHLNPSIGGYGKVSVMTEEWWEHLHFAIEKAADYNVDIGLFNSPGWSQSGGPWVEFEQSMRYLDSTEYSINGGSKVAIALSKPVGFTQDVKVIAFNTLAKENKRLTSKNTAVTVQGKEVNQLIDNDRSSVYQFPTATSELYIDFVHDEILTARTLEIFPHNTYSAKATLLAKNAAGEFEPVKSFVLQRPRSMAAIGPDHDAPIVINFPAVAASEYRLSLKDINLGRKSGNKPPGIKEIVLSGAYKLERYVEKKLAKVHPTPQPKHDSYLWDAPLAANDPTLAIAADQVLDITEFVSNDTLDWQAPEGQWTIVHYYMRPTGTENGPSSKNARGPEIDKLSKAIAQSHFDAYVGKVLQSLAPEKRSALKYVVVDSYEKGAQNWTDEFVKKFEAQYGYSPISFLPVYTGRIVNSAEQSERFLWDVRRLVADSVAHEYTVGLRERAHQHGLKLWLENYGHWGFPGEFLQYGGQADIVSGEFWASGNLGAIELKAASSAAHIYGHKTVMSESFTAGRGDAFKNHPWNFKKRGDWSFVEGINHTLLHVYIQQAYDDKFPGVNAWFGSEFNRNNTWFDFMGSWLDYVKRSNYMMQQGRYVADIMYFIGEDTPKMTGELKPAVPHGYSYDFINAEVILHRLSVKDGLFHLPNGMTFSLLVLPDLTTMRPAVLNKLEQLVAAGGKIYGPKPTRSPSLQNATSSDGQILQVAQSLWQDIDGKLVTQTTYGKGTVFYVNDANSEVDLSVILQQIDTPADLSGLPETVLWSHRSSDTHEIYFIANQLETTVTITPSIRLMDTMGQPQYWDAVTGEVVNMAQYQLNNGRIAMPMELQGLESAFIVFEKHADNKGSRIASTSIKRFETSSSDGMRVEAWMPSAMDDKGNIAVDIAKNGTYQIQLTNGKKQTLSVSDLPEPVVMPNPWQLTLQAGRDVTTSLEIDELTSLSELEPLALKHYSGTVVYDNNFEITAELLRTDQRWVLELGEVGVIARVRVNGKELGEVWSRPLQLDITEALVTGENKLEIEVATTWVNRMVGDLKYPTQFPDSEKPKEFETEITFESKISKGTELEQTGLIGPVLIKPVRKMAL